MGTKASKTTSGRTIRTNTDDITRRIGERLGVTPEDRIEVLETFQRGDGKASGLLQRVANLERKLAKLCSGARREGP